MMNKVKVLFSNSYDYMFLIPYLQKFSPIPLTMHWYDKRYQKHLCGFICAEKSYPEFFFNVPDGINNHRESTLVAYTSVDKYKHIQQQYYQHCSYIDVEESTLQFQKSIVQGLYVDKTQWNVIQNFEKSVFVSSNDISRSRAEENEHAIDTEDIVFKNKFS